MPSRRPVTGIILGAAILFGIAAPAHADKCTSAKLRAIGAKEAGLLACSSKAATKTVTGCEDGVRTHFAKAYDKPTGCVPPAPPATQCETVADQCQVGVRSALPVGNGTTPSKCEAARLRAAGKLAKGELACYVKAAAKGAAVDSTCVPKAIGKFTAAFDKATPCAGDASTASAIQTVVENDCVTSQVSSQGTSTSIICASAVTTTTVTTTTTTSTTAATTTTTPTTSTTTTTINASALSLVETAVAGTPTGIAAAEIFLAPGFASGYANVVIDLDRDGLEPDTDPAHGGDWWVQNFPVVINPASPTGAVAMTFALGTIVPSGSYDVYASFTAGQVATPDLATMVLTPQVPFGIYDIGTLQSGAMNGLTAGGAARVSAPRAGGASHPTGAVQRLVAGGRTLVERVFGRAQAAGPDGDLRTNIPGILQGANECAPTAAAQSLLWLQDTQGLQGLPAQDQLIDQLKRAMQPSWTSGTYPGIDFANFVPGKDTVTQDLMLPIQTMSDGSPGAGGTFDFIRAQIEANADVELRIEYASGGGHVLTVAGWFDDGSSRVLCFKDPLTGGQTIDCYGVFGSTIPLYKYGDDALIDSAVAESIVTTTTTTLPTGGCAPDGTSGCFGTPCGSCSGGGHCTRGSFCGSSAPAVCVSDVGPTGPCQVANCDSDAQCAAGSICTNCVPFEGGGVQICCCPVCP